MNTLPFALTVFSLMGSLGCGTTSSPPRIVYLSTDNDVKAHEEWHYAPV
jgi:hypothetical protein